LLTKYIVNKQFAGSKRYGSSSSYSSHSPPVPERWLKCPRKSYTTITEKFVAFKTPLDSKYDDQIPIQNRFNTEMLFSSMSNMKVLRNTI
jgi:mRNA-capping enzyme